MESEDESVDGKAQSLPACVTTTWRFKEEVASMAKSARERREKDVSRRDARRAQIQTENDNLMVLDAFVNLRGYVSYRHQKAAYRADMMYWRRITREHLYMWRCALYAETASQSAMREAVLCFANQAIRFGFRGWHRQLQEGRALARRMSGAVRRMLNRKLSMAFEQWQANAAQMKHEQVALRRALMRMVSGKLSRALHMWRATAVELGRAAYAAEGAIRRMLNLCVRSRQQKLRVVPPLLFLLEKISVT